MRAVAAAGPEAGAGSEDGGGFGGGSGAAGAEPGCGVCAGTGGGLVPGHEKSSALGWSLVLCKEASFHSGLGQMGRCLAGHVVEPASPAPVDSKIKRHPKYRLH